MISTRSVTSVRTVSKNRSAKAFARGLRGGISIAAIPALARVLDLDAPVFEYVPALRQLQPVARAERITPRHLLTQRWVL